MECPVRDALELAHIRLMSIQTMVKDGEAGVVPDQADIIETIEQALDNEEDN